MGMQQLQVFGVPLNIASELGNPIVVIAAGQLSAVTTIVPVPEAAVDKDYPAKAREDQVRHPWQFAHVQPVAKSVPMNETAHQELWACVDFLDARHALAEGEFMRRARHSDGSGE